MSSEPDTRLRLQDASIGKGFPPHISEILNPRGRLTCKDFLCRLLHVCMVEVGFLPVTEDDEECEAEELVHSEFSESVPKLIRRLQKVIEKTGSLQSVTYRAIIMEQFTSSEEEASKSEMSGATPINFPEKKSGINIPVTGKASGDGSSSSVAETPSVESMEGEGLSPEKSIQWRKAFSGRISVGTIYDGGEMIMIATGPGFHQNSQVSIFQYIHTRNMVLPTATMEEYLRVFNFSPCQFVNDIKRRFCYMVMDEVDGLSFDLRSLAWFPRELIVEIAKHCSPVQVFRLRATCHTIRDALGKTNGQFWSFLLGRDFPQYHSVHLSANSRDDKYYEKYCELCKFTFRRPVRRTLGGYSRMLPLYLSGNFQNW